MLLDLPLPMCRAGNKAGDGWMKGIPIDTSNCGGTLNRLLNRLFRTWENELELPVWPMWLRAIMAPYVGGKCPGTICSTSSKTHRSGFHFKRRDLGDVCVFFFFGKQKWLFEGWGANRSAFFTQNLGHQCVESWASRFTCFTSLSFGRACVSAALLRWWWMRSSGLTGKWESSGFHWI